MHVSAKTAEEKRESLGIELITQTLVWYDRHMTSDWTRKCIPYSSAHRTVTTVQSSYVYILACEGFYNAVKCLDSSSFILCSFRRIEGCQPNRQHNSIPLPYIGKTRDDRRIMSDIAKIVHSPQTRCPARR